MEIVIDKLNDFPGFVPWLCHGFMEIAHCPENQLTKTGTEVKLETPPYLIKYVDPSYSRNLNRDILKYVNYIKEIALGYLKKFALEKANVKPLVFKHNDLIMVLGNHRL